ncbi:hypothetical protein LS68_002945 [Helicobacter sp. MIT 05-5293]|uniref:hypothetical protein n=1 Tax=Helicobacter sp. MIT 05-5293 TaxID=1548149 RepID=UPI00051D7B95|nr:hypothetical protein [Helicobacter sp. MIT 05-5293]TLD81986.1 hypothetical protein LS68_002945 [Helicobacter sp. MIT 05-5293]
MPLFLIIEAVVIFIGQCVSAFFAVVTLVLVFGLNLFLSLPQPIRYTIIAICVLCSVRYVYRRLSHRNIKE